MPWSFFVDRGGTFTDCIGKAPDGHLHVTKVLSCDKAPIFAIRKLLGLAENQPIPNCEVRMGSTVATNALLERKGAKTAFVVTQGFGDLLEIGTQARPDLFALDIRKPAVLYECVVELNARLSASGEVLESPDLEDAACRFRELADRGVTSIAIAFLHSYRDGSQEAEVAQLAHICGIPHVTVSHEVAPELGFLNRATTTVVDAYLSPPIQAHLAALQYELRGSTLQLMQSSGTLTQASHFRGSNAILSGPAGGVVGYARIAESLGFQSAIGFDMGGTSTDVSRFEGAFERDYEGLLAGVRIVTPTLRIHTIAAGGGSVCRFDGTRFTVGPESAGARPGPLCYGHPDATELTLTDVNLLLGRLHPSRFPLPLETERAQRELERLTQLSNQHGSQLTLLGVAEGLLEIANLAMADAIRKVSLARGFDVRNDVLFVFGGAGGQHACAIARQLEMSAILFHPLSGVLSALGMGLADEGWHGSADAGRRPLSPRSLSELALSYERLEREGRAHFEMANGLEVLRSIQLRYAGSNTQLVLDFSDSNSLTQNFHAQHQREFGYHRQEHTIEIVQARVEVLRKSTNPADNIVINGAYRVPVEGTGKTRLYCNGRWHDDVPLVWRERLGPGQLRPGPLLVLDATGTLVVEPDFQLEVLAGGVLKLTRRDLDEPCSVPAPGEHSPDPISLEVMGRSYMAIAEQMGENLRRTALSTNIRERLDFSCAVFDGKGNLVANAPHIPVHLGAMSESVKAVMLAHPRMLPGDVFATNDPARGGSHLPDITLVTPVHDSNGQLCFFTASRGHHADVGGITPGSMPPFSRHIREEGIVLRALPIVTQGHFNHGVLLAAFSEGPYPSRNPAMNVADIEAQLAANQLGKHLLLKLVDRHGLGRVAAYMQYVQQEAANKVRTLIESLGSQSRTFEDTLDDGSIIRVRIDGHAGTLRIDFSGSSGELPGNLNAPRAVTVAAVMYCLQSLARTRLPLNAGCMKPIELVIERGSLLDPAPHLPVAGGNVETSQRVVDVLLGALNQAAASQGTMNNLTFGNQSFGYYETIGGGAGAGPTFPGASAVHTHMTNTHITDAEVLECQYPVRLVQFSRRRGSGGNGHFSGGDGIIREFEFLCPLNVSLISERRQTVPFGLNGGEPGAIGINALNGGILPGKATFSVNPGDRLRIETPGGGGYGPSNGEPVR